MHFLIAAPGATLARAPPFFWWPGTTARAHQFAPEGSFQSEDTIMARRINAPSPADLITQAFIDRLEAGVRPWIKPLRPRFPRSRPLRATCLPFPRHIRLPSFWASVCQYFFFSVVYFSLS